MTKLSTPFVLLTFAFTFTPIALAQPQSPKAPPMPRTVRREACETLADAVVFRRTAQGPPAG